MITKRFSFWSMDIIKTEEKLSQYAADGMILKSFSRSGKAEFADAEPCNREFRIVRSKKCNGKAPEKLLEKSWKASEGSKNHYVVSREKDAGGDSPSYKNWISYYRGVNYGLFLAICFIVGIICGIVSTAIAKDKFLTVLPLLIVLATVDAFLVAIALRLNKSNKKILAMDKDSVKFSFTVPTENFVYSREEEKAMLKKKTMLKVSKSTWFAEPDKASEWIEEMASKGWRLYRIDKTGSAFFFIKSEPCHIKLVVDFQDEISNEYIEMTKADGWKLEFASVPKVGSYCVWSKAYNEGEDVPELYTDNESTLAYAKNHFVKIVIPSILCVIVSIGIILMNILNFDNSSFFDFCLAAVFLYFGVIYGIFSVAAIRYYLRLKKKIKVC